MDTSQQKIDTYLAGLPDWQRQLLTEFRQLVHQIVPGVTEEWKWNVPMFSTGGKPLVGMSAFKAHVKYNFIKNGASLNDTHGLFNNGLESKTSRSIDIYQGETVNQNHLRQLLKQAAKLD